MYDVASYTFPWMMTQQSSCVQCLLTSKEVKTRLPSHIYTETQTLAQQQQASNKQYASTTGPDSTRSRTPRTLAL